MRLRPSGTQGPIATSLAAFRRYHDELAWTWEQMSLTRARAVAGDESLSRMVMIAVRDVLTRPRDSDRLVADVAEMRARIAEQHRAPGPFELKFRRGGMVDIEFIAQYLQLREAARRPDLLQPNTQAALLALADDGALARPAADELAGTLELWRDLQNILRLTVGEPFAEGDAAPALLTLIALAARAGDFAALRQDMEAKAERAFAWYERIVAAPAAAASARLAATLPEKEKAP